MKKSLALVFTLLGAAGLIYGVVTLFNGGISNSNAWIGVILGLIFFSSGMGLLKSTSSSEESA